MARTGRPPKPLEAKRRIGNPGGRPLSAGLTVISPASVIVLDGGPTTGRELVDALLAGPAAAWIADPDRIALLELVAQAWDERTELRKSARELPSDWTQGRYVPAVLTRLERVERNLTSWLSMLGLSPIDRSRLGVAEVKARTKLEELRARRAGRSRAG